MREGHFAQPLEARDVHLALAGKLGLHQFVLVGIIPRIKRLAALADAVERWQGKIKVPVLDQPRHLLEEEGDEQ
ncbi:hypothetical protein D9M72_643330 [compost metagenome]